MSIARTAILRPVRTALVAAPRRAASIEAVTEHHDDHHHAVEDTTVYPPENFSGKFWRNVVLFTIGGVAVYKFAPRNDQETVLGNLVGHWTTAHEAWTKAANKHLAQSVDMQETVWLTTEAKRPPIHRYRFPQMIGPGHSPFLQPVGNAVNYDDVVVKTAQEYR